MDFLFFTFINNVLVDGLRELQHLDRALFCGYLRGYRLPKTAYKMYIQSISHRHEKAMYIKKMGHDSSAEPKYNVICYGYSYGHYTYNFTVHIERWQPWNDNFRIWRRNRLYILRSRWYCEIVLRKWKKRAMEIDVHWNVQLILNMQTKFTIFESATE